MLTHFRTATFFAAFLCATAVAREAEPPGYGAVACNAAGGADPLCQPDLHVAATMKEQSKIVGGRQAAPGSYPWAVAVARRVEGRLRSFCSGSIVASRWVLTAAHCKALPGDVVIVGRSDLASTTGREIKVARVVVQPQFDPKTMNNDAALLRLEEDAPGVSIALNDDRQIEATADTELSVAGWGSTSYLGPPSQLLMEKDLFTLNILGCKSVYSHLGFTLSDTMFCADGEGTSKRSVSGKRITDVCQGDGGGGAVRWDPATNGYQLVGIVSWGVGCGEKAFPGVYTSVSAIASWAQQQIRAE